jgi:hypothetical protein
LEEFPIDERKIIPSLWGDGDEVVITRLRELLMRMDEVDSDRFAITLTSLQELDLQPMWAPFEIKDKKRANAWKAWIAGEGEQPAKTELPKIHVSDMSEPEIPELDDALTTLDDLGFLD